MCGVLDGIEAHLGKDGPRQVNTAVIRQDDELKGHITHRIFGLLPLLLSQLCTQERERNVLVL